MGADSFVAFYGVKIALNPDDEEVFDACGDNTDPRCIAAQQVGLDTFNGRMTDGEDYFLYVGRQLAWMGLEHDTYAAADVKRLAGLAADVDAKLKAAGFAQAAALHFQFIGQY
ncbi:hypothetical protein GCM10027277_07430 [Pseudoduganella ginsengisoli]|uniref:Uncharacterized protein n=1 Tax=Pseudoduganella ginsengisoli TaxID=1462440 RepID=A0A6L6Q8H4_9BURK|nr:hypothetical protein [Pseudoduganella ginsengisoli]MTW05940.1 hypothetical protein [Pseudoduganella ginsengisoli]